LSKSGESIFLLDTELSIIDESSFGQQITDKSTGRYPNGTGDFVEMQPTFGAENMLYTGVRNALLNQDENKILNIYPSPASEEITVTVSESLSGISTIQIINLLGEVVYSENAELSESTIIYIREFKSGIYFLKLQSAGKVYLKRFVKQ
jgi:hypothetical protein